MSYATNRRLTAPRPPLASDASRFMTGQMLNVDGVVSARYFS